MTYIEVKLGVGFPSCSTWYVVRSRFSQPTTCAITITFGNNAPTIIRGKWTIVVDEDKKGKTKAHNVLYVYGLKHNLLSVSQMCDQGDNDLFHSKGFKVMDENTRKTVVKEIQNRGNVSVLEGGKEKCCIGKTYERWIWHKRLGNLSFN